jgi:predicted RNA-binding protein with PIN domain
MAGPTFLIDGYNLLHSLKEPAELARQDMKAARERLVEMLALWRGRRGVTVVVVFDGARGQWSAMPGASSVRVVFSRAPLKADEELVRLVAQHPHPRSVTVVSSDQQVMARVRSFGAATLCSEEFAARLVMVERGGRGGAPDEKREPRLSRTELEEWERYFEQGRRRAQG